MSETTQPPPNSRLAGAGARRLEDHDGVRHDRRHAVFRPGGAGSGHPGLLLAFVLAPLVELLRRLHLGKVPSVLLGVIVALGVILAIGGVIGAQSPTSPPTCRNTRRRSRRRSPASGDYTVGRIACLADSVGVRTAGRRRCHAPAARAGRPGQASAAPPAAAPAAPAPAASSPLEFATSYLGAGAVAAGDLGHRVRGRGVRLAAAGGPARPPDPSARLGRPAPHHGRRSTTADAASAATSSPSFASTRPSAS